MRPEPIKVPAAEAIQKHTADLVVIDKLRVADAETAQMAFDHLTDIIDKHPTVLDDPTIQEKLNAILDRLEELGLNPLEEEVETPDTIH